MKTATAEMTSLAQEMFGMGVVSASENSITVRVSNWDGTAEEKVTLDDVVEYFATQACNITSGCRTLAGIDGDWRMIDAIAQDCLTWFKEVNVDALREKARARGMEPRF